jgi:hypothetical protein
MVPSTSVRAVSFESNQSERFINTQFQQTKTLDGNINSILHVFDRLLRPCRMSALPVSG